MCWYNDKYFILVMKKTWVILSSTLVLFTVAFFYTISDKAVLYWQDGGPEVWDIILIWEPSSNCCTWTPILPVLFAY